MYRVGYNALGGMFGNGLELLCIEDSPSMIVDIPGILKTG